MSVTLRIVVFKSSVNWPSSIVTVEDFSILYVCIIYIFR